MNIKQALHHFNISDIHCRNYTTLGELLECVTYREELVDLFLTMKNHSSSQYIYLKRTDKTTLFIIRTSNGHSVKT